MLQIPIQDQQQRLVGSAASFGSGGTPVDLHSNTLAASASALGTLIPGSAIETSGATEHASRAPPVKATASSGLKRDRDEDNGVPVQPAAQPEAGVTQSEESQQQPKKAKVEPSVAE